VLAFWRVPRIQRVREIGRYDASPKGTLGTRPSVATRVVGDRHSGGTPLLVNHDDADREFAFTAGAEESLARAEADGWTVIIAKVDWSTVFAEL
jgi:hypothetical protein